MAQFIEYLKRIKPVYRRSSNRMKIIVTAVILLAIVGLIVLYAALGNLNEANDMLAGQAAALEQENSTLLDRISIQGTKEAVVQIARDLLGLVTPDTVVVQPKG